MALRGILGLMVACVCLSGCDDRWRDYNYRMTVWVGDKAFSSVRHVEVTERATIQDSSGRRVDRKVTGEAVILETPSGPVFALLTPEEGNFGNGSYGSYVAEPALVPAIGKTAENEVQQAVREWREGQPNYDWLAGEAEQHNTMLETKGARNLPRTVPNPDRYRGPREIPVWPMFVSFADISDPSTVRKLSPESIGVTRITIEVTNDDPTTGIKEKLTWLDQVLSEGGAIDRTRFPGNNQLKSNLGAGAFLADNH